MPVVPYPLTSDELAELKPQIIDMFRDIYENRVGGGAIGDVFGVIGDVLELKLMPGCGLKKTNGLLDIDIDILSSSGTLVKSMFTAKGVIVVGNGVSAIYALPVGSDATVLKASSGSTGGMIWANVLKEEITGLKISDSPTFTSLKLSGVKSGATQATAGAAANEVWKTSGHATLPDNVLMIGV